MGGFSIPSGIRWKVRLLGAALLLSLPAAAPAQDTSSAKPVDIRRLRFEYKCLFEEFKGKAENEFLGRLRSQRAVYEAKDRTRLPEMEDLLTRALGERMKFYQGSNDLDSASGLATEILPLKNTTDQSAKIRDEADTLLIDYSLAKALKEEKANPEVAWKAYRDCTGTKKREPLGKAVAGMVRIACGRRAYDPKNPPGDILELVDALGAILKDLQDALTPEVYAGDFKDIRDMEQLKKTNEGDVGFVEVEFKDYDLGGYRLGRSALDPKTATFSFEPLSEGAKWPTRGDSAPVLKALLPLRKGVYDVRVRIPSAGTDPVALYLRVETGEKARPLHLTVPTTFPDGMVFVGPWSGGGGFFIDRTEVTAGQVVKAMGGDAKLKEVVDNSRKDDPNYPAGFFEDAVAAWEQVSGKRLPSPGQWVDAAFGPYSVQERPYPWGTDTPKAGVHGFFGNPGVEEPKAVGSHRAGDTPFGLQDMVGNLGEWVRKDGGLWMMGGFYQLKPEALFGPEGKNWLRNPAPGPAAFKALGAAVGQYTGFKFDDQFYCGGLRMVVTVK